MMVRYDRNYLDADPDLGDPTTWINLNGLWEWEPETQNRTKPPFGKTLDSSILVPFPIESCLSGVAPNASSAYVSKSWYRLLLSFPLEERRERYLIHFGAVDWKSSLYADSNLIATHTGGYDGFTADLSRVVNKLNGRPLELLLHVYDPGDEGAQPNGKQRISSISNPQGDQYTPCTGVWQTVWLEKVPATAYVKGLQVGANITTLVATAFVEPAIETMRTNESENVLVEVLDPNGGVAVIASQTIPAGTAASINIPSPQIWSPDSPILYPLRVSIVGEESGILSYFGMRAFELYTPPTQQGAVPILNGNEIFLAGWLDQSYWPDGIYTAPTDEALLFDLQAVKHFGLNMVRLHQKVNPERWYYHADRLGILIFQDAVQKYLGASKATIPHFEADLVAMIKGRGNHPSIIQWTAFNEEDCWGVFNETSHSISDIVALIRETDWQDRLVDTDSGGRANGLLDKTGNVNDIHSYPWPGNPTPDTEKYAMVGEFGGLGFFVDGSEWMPGKCFAYLECPTAQNITDAYVEMARQLRVRSDHIRASVYTQITDVEVECDGFLNYDRSIKFSPSQLRRLADANRALIASVGQDAITAVTRLLRDPPQN